MTDSKIFLVKGTLKTAMRNGVEITNENWLEDIEMIKEISPSDLEILKDDIKLALALAERWTKPEDKEILKTIPMITNRKALLKKLDSLSVG